MSLLRRMGKFYLFPVKFIILLSCAFKTLAPTASFCLFVWLLGGGHCPEAHEEVAERPWMANVSGMVSGLSCWLLYVYGYRLPTRLGRTRSTLILCPQQYWLKTPVVSK